MAVAPVTPVPTPEPSSRVLRGMGFMLVSAMCYAGMSAAIHGLGDDLHPAMVAFFRSLFGLLAALPLILRNGGAVLRTSRIGLHALRTALATASMYTFYIALSLSSLAKVTALHFTTPVFATVMTILFLGERVRARRIIALVAGFSGAMIIMRPGIAAFDIGAVLVLCTSCMWGAGLAVTKIMAPTESSLTTAAYLGIFSTLMTLGPALYFWQTPDAVQLVLLLVAGTCGTISHTCIAQAFREAEATAVLPVDFSRLIFASALGYFIFAEVPDIWTWVGGTVIFCSGTYIAYRERQVSRQVTVAADGRP